jgi:hypothetical protein
MADFHIRLPKAGRAFSAICFLFLFVLSRAASSNSHGLTDLNQPPFMYHQDNRTITHRPKGLNELSEQFFFTRLERRIQRPSRAFVQSGKKLVKVRLHFFLPVQALRCSGGRLFCRSNGFPGHRTVLNLFIRLKNKKPTCQINFRRWVLEVLA